MTSKSWGAELAKSRRPVDTHRSAHPAKIELRRNVLSSLGAENCRVLDLFAGSGGMYRDVWREAASYVGCDERPFLGDPRQSYVCDNRRLLRCVDLEDYNVFDLDAYGSPWEQATILAARRKLASGELIGLCLTDGAARRAKFGRIEGCLADLAGVSPLMPGAHRRWEDISAAAVVETARRMSGGVAKLWHAPAPNRSMLYSAAVISRR